MKPAVNPIATTSPFPFPFNIRPPSAPVTSERNCHEGTSTGPPREHSACDAGRYSARLGIGNSEHSACACSVTVPLAAEDPRPQRQVSLLSPVSAGERKTRDARQQQKNRGRLRHAAPSGSNCDRAIKVRKGYGAAVYIC